MSQLTNDNPFGILFFRFSNLKPLNYEEYFSCLNLIRPLLGSPDFKVSTPGYYLNYNDYSVRLTCFTNNERKTKGTIDNFLKENVYIALFKSKQPKVGNIAEGYGGDNSRFRRFLSAYTQIGLDLLNYDNLYSRRLVAEYRLTYSTQKISCKPLFEPAFTKHSKFFNQLDTQSVEQIWKDLNFWHPIPKEPKCVADWAHFLVNMLLPGDYIHASKFKELFTNPNPRPPIIDSQKEQMLRLFNIDMPNNWSPNN
ncbi:MAG TPA: hypothetical protein G4O12_06900 [Dehalococcoidia bacterium]|nr:hypothetical protein [Dehalococcoidia bacterium]